MARFDNRFWSRIFITAVKFSASDEEQEDSLSYERLFSLSLSLFFLFIIIFRVQCFTALTKWKPPHNFRWALLGFCWAVCVYVAAVRKQGNPHVSQHTVFLPRQEQTFPCAFSMMMTFERTTSLSLASPNKRWLLFGGNGENWDDSERGCSESVRKEKLPSIITR